MATTLTMLPTDAIRHIGTFLCHEDWSSFSKTSNKIRSGYKDNFQFLPFIYLSSEYDLRNFLLTEWYEYGSKIDLTIPKNLHDPIRMKNIVDLLNQYKCDIFHNVHFVADPKYQPIIDLILDHDAFDRIKGISISLDYDSNWILPRIVASPRMRSWTHLKLCGWVKLETIKMIADSPNALNLESIDLENTDVGTGAVTYLANSPNLPSLAKINLSHCLLSSYVLDPLFRMNRLTHITIGHVGNLGDNLGDKLDKLQRATEMDQLVHLDLRYNLLTQYSISRLTKTPHLANLTELNLSGNIMGTSGAQRLAKSSYLKRLIVLSLDDCHLGTGGVQHIITSENIETVRKLSIATNQIDSHGAASIARSRRLKNLRELNISHNQIGAKGASDLVSSRRFKNLTHLEIGENGIELNKKEEIFEKARQNLPKLKKLFFFSKDDDLNHN